MFKRLKLPLNVTNVTKLRNASGKDIKTHWVMTAKFKIGNTIFIQDFVLCENLVRPIIIGRDFTVNNFKALCGQDRGQRRSPKMTKQ